MRYLKIYENNEDIQILCDKYLRKVDYTINRDETIDVRGDVNLSKWKFGKIPLNFNKVYGLFNCSYNNLIDLKGSPKYTLHFICEHNKLTDLKFGPSEVGTNERFNIHGVRISDNGYYYFFAYNKIKTLDGFPNKFSGTITYKGNPIENILNLLPHPKDNNIHICKFIRYLNEYDVIRENGVVLDRLEQAYRITTGEEINLIKGYPLL